MKKPALLHLLLPFIALITFACSEGSKSNRAEPVRITSVLEDVSKLIDWTHEHQNPIEAFRHEARDHASEVIALDRSNIRQALHKAKQYKYCIIVVDNHTLISIKDVENCRQSGSWDACMPYAAGYIQRGGLVPQEDYANNIIGTPDLQERLMFLFDE